MRLALQILLLTAKLSYISLRRVLTGGIVMAKNKHLTELGRLQIEQWLKQRVSIKKLAENPGESASTISREIRSRAVSQQICAP